MNEALEFLKNCRRGSGRIVCTSDLNHHQIEEATKEGRLFVDEGTGWGWAVLPWKTTTEKDTEREEARNISAN